VDGTVPMSDQTHNLRAGNGRFSVQGREGTRQRRPRWQPARAAAAVPVAAALFLAAACSGGGVLGVGAKPKPTQSPLAQLTITPANGSKNVKPGEGITVTAAHGKVTNVSVQTSGTQVTGTLSADGTAWHSKWTLGTNQRFVVTATAVTTAGKTTTATSSFHTLRPGAIFQTQIFEGSGQVYGVGMPIKLTFSQPITNKAAVERAMEVRTSTRIVGVWWWDGDQTLDFRPQDYWPAGTKISFIGHLDGLEGAPGMYGVDDLSQSFSIGDSLIVRVSTSHHEMKVYKNGRHIYTWPISSGKPGDDTPNGTFLTIDKGNPVRMKPADISRGSPGYYDVLVYWSVRFTWSGDYIHSAPWSVGNQGNSNVSHGCVNLGPSHAPIYYNMEVPGDPVIVTGSPANGVWDDGWTDWFLSWPQVLSRSATHDAVVAGPTGSSFVSPQALLAPRPPASSVPATSATPASAAPSSPAA
jgi:lipoprotein-anchoring transpeptidase ErfK/SrfK